MTIKTLVMGLGNELLGDEGVGVHAARRLQLQPLSKIVEIIAAGTAILDTLWYPERAERVIIIDAMKAGGSPGTLYRTELSDCREKDAIASMHGFDIFRVMAMTGKKELPEVTVFGVEPEHIGWSLKLSPAVHRTVPHLLKIVEKECYRAN